MSDTPENSQKAPLSSSSSAPSGTQALSVAIEPEQEERLDSQATEEEALDLASPDTDPPLAVAMDGANQPPSEAVSAEPTELPEPHEAEDSTMEASASPETDDVNELIPEVATAALSETVAETVETESVTAEHNQDELRETVGEESTERPETHEAGDLTVDASASPETGDVNELIPEVASAAPSEPVTETVETESVTAEANQDELRETVRQVATTNEAQGEKAIALFAQISNDFQAVMDDARSDAARISFKLMEFAQANLQNNITLARDYVDVRSVPEIFNAQASYFKRQIELLNKQTEELRRMTSDIASKKAARLQNRMRVG